MCWNWLKMNRCDHGYSGFSGCMPYSVSLPTLHSVHTECTAVSVRCHSGYLLGEDSSAGESFRNELWSLHIWIVCYQFLPIHLSLLLFECTHFALWRTIFFMTSHLEKARLYQVILESLLPHRIVSRLPQQVAHKTRWGMFSASSFKLDDPKQRDDCPHHHHRHHLGLSLPCLAHSSGSKASWPPRRGSLSDQDGWKQRERGSAEPQACSKYAEGAAAGSPRTWTGGQGSAEEGQGVGAWGRSKKASRSSEKTAAFCSMGWQVIKKMETNENSKRASSKAGRWQKNTAHHKAKEKRQ